VALLFEEVKPPPLYLGSLHLLLSGLALRGRLWLLKLCFALLIALCNCVAELACGL
jgi:hypothetical protein